MQGSSHSWVSAFNRWAAATFPRVSLAPVDTKTAIFANTQTKLTTKKSVVFYTFVIVAPSHDSWTIVQTRYSACRTLYAAVKAWARAHRTTLRDHPAYPLAAYCEKLRMPSRTLGFDDYYTIVERKAALTTLVELLWALQSALGALEAPVSCELQDRLERFFGESGNGAQLSSRTVTAFDSIDVSDECAICLDTLQPGAKGTVVALTCGHVFHDRCALKWLWCSSACAPASNYAWLPAFNQWAATSFPRVPLCSVDTATTIYTSAHTKPDTKEYVVLYTFVILTPSHASWTIVQTRYSACRTLYAAVKAWARAHRATLRDHPAYPLAAYCEKLRMPSRTLGFDDYYTIVERKAALTTLVELLWAIAEALRTREAPALVELQDLLDSFFHSTSAGVEHTYRSSTTSSVAPSGDCAICLGELARRSVFQLPCAHVFHQECVLQWFHYQNTCAVCRQESAEGNIVHKSVQGKAL
ncbi:hypothetical protein ACHHYP_10508 [Achlya hypogyna]|uniref:RING-type domain-containing protein n=1 Tax=Achlya hypogyna TaxID=1202772 RepID=A0A1V9YL94_ACHHY|nr:hypothetical protein ACHHYP_10508 [Achlya hypogyna]